jgi:hypothetical protein
MAEDSSPDKEKGEDPKDPKVYWKKFLNWEKFTEALKKRKPQVRQKNKNATDEQIFKAFLNVVDPNDPNCPKELFKRFYEEKGFSYNRHFYSEEFREKLLKYTNYITLIDEKSKFEHPTQDEIQFDESKRMDLHNTVAEQLVKEEIVPNNVFGRLIAHFIAVDLGIDKYNPDRDIIRQVMPRI